MTQQSLDACYQKGRQILAKSKDHRLAVELFAQCVEGDPSQLPYVEAFLECASAAQGRKRHSHGFALGLALRLARRREDWPAVFHQGVRRLMVNAWHVPTLLCLADACRQLHYNEVELRYLKQALDADPNFEKVNARCAEALARMGQFDQAIACWKRLENSKRYQALARERMYQLTLEKVNASRREAVPPQTPEVKDEKADTIVHEEEPAQQNEVPSNEEVPWEVDPNLIYSHQPDLSSADDPDAEVPRADPRPPYRPGLLEAALGVAMVGLVLQFYPGLLEILWQNIRVTAFVVNLLVILGLILFRQRYLNR